MNPETGRIQTKPADMSEDDWITYCEQNGLIPITSDEFRRLAPLRPNQRAHEAYDPEKYAIARELEARRKDARRAKGKSARAARKRR